MDSRKIVKHKIQAQSMNMVLDLLGVGIGQSGKSPHPHSDLQIHPPELGSCLKDVALGGTR
jgi:hypothetical protein